MTRPPSGRGHRDIHPSGQDGLVAVEAVLAGAAFGLLFWFLLAAGTAGHTPVEVTLAASDAARAAAATRDDAGRAARAEALVDNRLAALCVELTTTTQRDALSVRVTVDCRMHTQAMAALGLGPTLHRAVGVSTVDPFVAEGAP